MNFIKRVLSTKKVQRAKEKLVELDGKLEVSEKLEKAGDKIEAVLNDQISFKTFSKMEMRVGEILAVEDLENSDNLLKMKVSFGKEERQVIAGIKKFYKPEELSGQKAVFVTNLEPRKIMGLESQAMILIASEKDNFSILQPARKDLSAGAKIS